MNNTTHVLSTPPHNDAPDTSNTTESVRAWAAKLGWSVWHGFQAHATRRAMRQVRRMGLDVRQDIAPQASDHDIAGQSGASR